MKSECHRSKCECHRSKGESGVRCKAPSVGICIKQHDLMCLIREDDLIITILARFINDKEIEEGEDIHINFNRRDSTYTLVIDKASPELQGTLKAVAVSNVGEDLVTAELEVRGQAPVFTEVPIKCTILEGLQPISFTVIDICTLFINWGWGLH